MDLSIIYGIIIVVFAIAGFCTLVVVLMNIYKRHSRRARFGASDTDLSKRGDQAEDRCYRDCVDRLGNAGRTQCTWVCSAQFGT